MPVKLIKFLFHFKLLIRTGLCTTEFRIGVVICRLSSEIFFSNILNAEIFAIWFSEYPGDCIAFSISSFTCAC